MEKDQVKFWCAPYINNRYGTTLRVSVSFMQFCFTSVTAVPILGTHSHGQDTMGVLFFWHYCPRLCVTPFTLLFLSFFFLGSCLPRGFLCCRSLKRKDFASKNDIHWTLSSIFLTFDIYWFFFFFYFLMSTHTSPAVAFYTVSWLLGSFSSVLYFW